MDTVGAQVPDKVDFEQHVRPILSNHCWRCHGRDDSGRQGGLRLDRFESAVRAGDSGHAAIVPHRPDESLLIQKILTSDEDLVMPPPSAKQPLSGEQKAILSAWIAQGAEYSEHWAFVPPHRPEIPAVRHHQWPQTPLDYFVLSRLEAEGLEPSPEAPPRVWLRRVTLDLTGLPPTLDEQNDFLAAMERGPADTARAAVVDRLLQSTRYAERMAMHWLDVARYADTNGYNNDEMRTMWPWRDWVIQAFASGMPYDRFLTEQLAGDLLPNATLSQKVATGFNRNHVLTTEGGIIEEEYHVEYVADRIHTTSTVFLALSLQCARCHDHKYDPFSQRDYYQLSAFFNNVPDRIVSYSQGRMAEPLLKVPSPEQQAELDQLAARQTELEQKLQNRRTAIDAELSEWESHLTVVGPESAGSAALKHEFAFDETDGPPADRVNPGLTVSVQGNRQSVEGRSGKALKFDGATAVEAGDAGRFEADQAFTMSAWIRLETESPATVLSRIDESDAYRGYDLIMEGGRVAAHFVNHWPDRAFKAVTEQPVGLHEWHHVAVIYDGSRRGAGVRILVDGIPQKLELTTNNPLDGTLVTEKSLVIGRRQSSAAFVGDIDDVRLHQAALTDDDVRSLVSRDVVRGLEELVRIPRDQRTEEQRERLRDHFLKFVDADAQQWRRELEQTAKLREEVDRNVPVTMVMKEEPERRAAYILARGQYDQRGEQVRAAIPSVFRESVDVEAAVATNAEPTRLDLARWLTNRQHPLTARVAVNRWWEMLFGTGLVETSEDFGVQGALPTHPELLDWMACELMDSGWDTRAILRQIVLSATYRQSSDVSESLRERDPRNHLLARAPRFRLSAESVRDCALAVSGLLKEHVGGPSVKPYQPEGLWEDVSVERREKYVPDAGDGIYRRSMYTFWKRTCPPPTMATFDAPDRETCVVRRARTNTPLQALILMNDPTFVEASRKLAEHVLRAESGEDQRWSLAFRTVLCREPDPADLPPLQQVVSAAAEHFRSNRNAAMELLTVGRAPRDESLDPVELAGWSVAMSMLMNLDEAISRE